jgi:hypothetical protein
MNVNSKAFWRWYITLRITGFLDCLHYLSILNRTQHFGNWICFHPQVKRWGYQSARTFRSSYTQSLYVSLVQRLLLVLSNGPRWVHASPPTGCSYTVHDLSGLCLENEQIQIWLQSCGINETANVNSQTAQQAMWKDLRLLFSRMWCCVVG